MATTWTPTGSRSARSAQSTTETAPTDATTGVPLEGVDSIMPVLVAPGGQTFTGVGTLLGYIYVFAVASIAARWVRAPLADRDLSALSGLSEGALDAKAALPRAGLFMWVPSGVGLSGGSTVTIDYVCSLGSGRPTV